ncbi:MAG: alpha-amylase family glycosyl hydrolase [Haloarculaceae archaeon]
MASATSGGVLDRLDYVADLGVDVVWLEPVYASPQVDGGYDISDYRAIHDEYGTMADWEAFGTGSTSGTCVW